MISLFYQASKSLIAQRKRTLLTSFSIMLAVSVALFLVLFTDLAHVQVEKSLKDLIEKSQLVISPESRNHNPNKLPTVSEIDPVLQSLLSSHDYYYEFNQYQPIEHATTNRSNPIIITDWHYFKQHQLSLASGRVFNKWDSPSNRFAVVGSHIIKHLSPADRANHTLTIDQKIYNVIGVLKKTDGFMSDAYNETIWLHTNPYHIFHQPIEKVAIKVPSNLISPFKTDLLKRLERIYPHIIWHAKSTTEWVENIRKSQQKVKQLILTIAIACLITAALNLSNNLYFSIIQRKQEIAIRLAIGAKPKQIRNMFLAEITLICITSSFLGTLICEGFTYLLLKYLQHTFVFMWGPPLTIISICTLIGICACYLPARKASRVLPLDIIRQS
ncbi:MAG: ABC transporter permease [Pseudomonadota bacterium]|nr:ABC transporter permease [Pseudomonadota bacterium]